MIKTTTLVKALAVFLAFTLQTAFAAPIDLKQAYDKLLAADTTGEDCTLGMSGSGCPIPAGGVDIVDENGVITLSSPGNTAYLTDIATGTLIVFAAAAEAVVDFNFDAMQVEVSNILFNAAVPGSMTCTIYVDTVSPDPDCSSDSSPVLISGYDSIAGLNLRSFENFAHTFAYNVPVPAALLLFLSGLAGLVGIAGRKRRA